MSLEILFQDEHIVVINKPHGLLVHRSSIATNTNEFAVQTLRNQIGQSVHPIHRLDRKTAGVLLFSLDKTLVAPLQAQFANKTVEKTYLAIVRGYTEDAGTIDYELTNDKGKKQEAVTHYKTLERTEIALPFGKFETSRYALVEVKPETGRMHQIRKHFAHILHPIIGDRPHGCNKQNKLFLEKWEMNTMLLHAAELEFTHPITEKRQKIRANPSAEFARMLNVLEFSYASL